MIGQECNGYIPDSSGRLIRVLSEKKTDDFIGPGCYNPEIPHSSRSIKIPNNRKRDSFINDQHTPSPCSYVHTSKSTKIPHMIKTSPPYPDSPAPLGISLAHEPWAKTQTRRFPYERFPRAKYKKEVFTRQFESNSKRDVFRQPYRSPGPASHSLQPDPIQKSTSSNSAFKSKSDRFKESDSKTPSPAEYYIPDEFGHSQTKIITSPPTLILRKPKEVFETPSPGAYTPDIIHVPKGKRNRVFISKDERFTDDNFKTPSPDQYNIQSNDAQNSLSIHKRCNRCGYEWSYVPQKETPAVGSYNIRNEKIKDGYISTIGHDPYEKKEDRPMAFRTNHKSFIKKSYNARYMNVNFYK
ncbi:hypothetical protein GPJ56_006868 [Histomonas meleagridis]|uniref:uncharacterized protein n=1 Tax=Histomonas meleagridis TaxID=135588 RepID=UPI003559B717|nr:hypothetical protein GPJ56_006868 [Histomonas meleagridis]KAH0802358.1 hypothetical protein GO595_004971 [Histomonas meleagridis]